MLVSREARHSPNDVEKLSGNSDRPQTEGPASRKNGDPRIGETERRSPIVQLHDDQNHGPGTAPAPFQTLSLLDFSHLRVKGVGYARHQSAQREVIEVRTPYRKR